MSSGESGWNSNTRLRLTSASFTAKNGFGVVAPTRITTPSSTSGSSTSCCALLKRWISSMNSSVGRPPAATSSRASSSTSRRSFTPLVTALSCRKRLSVSCAEQPGQRRLAGARRAVKDHRPQPLARSIRRSSFPSPRNAAGRRTPRATAAASAPPAAAPAPDSAPSLRSKSDQAHREQTQERLDDAARGK